MLEIHNKCYKIKIYFFVINTSRSLKDKEYHSIMYKKFDNQNFKC